MKNSKIRLFILIFLTIVSAVFFALTVIPNSPFINRNICMDNEKAKKMYASNNSKAKSEYIEKRNNDCKTMLKYAVPPKTTYDKIDTCNMVDSVVDASNHYMEAHKGDKSLINGEINYIARNIKKYSYCPQYKDVIKSLIDVKKQLK